jgi:hypothetical protein
MLKIKEKFIISLLLFPLLWHRPKRTMRAQSGLGETRVTLENYNMVAICLQFVLPIFLVNYRHPRRNFWDGSTPLEIYRHDVCVKKYLTISLLSVV